MTKEEKAILSYFVNEMESKGLTKNSVLITFSDAVLQEINNNYSTSLNDENLDTYINKLLASEHIKQRCMSGCKNSNLQITSKGVAVITSLRAKEELLQNRTFLKRVSDFIDNHKGIISLIAIVLALVSFVLRLKGII